MRPTKSRLNAMLVVAGSIGVATSILSVACADDGRTPGFDPGIDGATPDGGPAATQDQFVPVDSGDPDARGPFDPADQAVVCDASPCATQLVAGRDHFCTRMNDGTVRCWGRNGFGVLGSDPPLEEPVPGDAGADASSTVQVIPDLEGATRIGAAGATTCALLANGDVKCWGDNRRGQLGLAIDPPVSDFDPHPTPALVPLEAAASRIDVGQGIVCAQLANGKLWCWGEESQAQLARPNSEPGKDIYAPVLRGPGVAALEPLTLSSIAISDYSMIGLSAQGEVWSWGAVAGETGTISGRFASVNPNPTPKRVGTLGKVTSLVASVWIDPPFDPPPGPTPPEPPPYAHACAIADGEVYCWGLSNAGALCTGYPDRAQEPAHAPFASTVKTWPQQLAVGEEITCARMTDGTIYCCGSDTHGRLGTGDKVILSSAFTRARAFTRRAVQVATSDRAVCALVEDGTVECWGSNEKGELGFTADTADHLSPVRVSF